MKTSPLVCPLCTYNSNPPQATKCEICGTSLKSGAASQRNFHPFRHRAKVKAERSRTNPQEISSPNSSSVSQAYASELSLLGIDLNSCDRAIKPTHDSSKEASFNHRNVGIKQKSTNFLFQLLLWLTNSLNSMKADFSKQSIRGVKRVRHRNSRGGASAKVRGINIVRNTLLIGAVILGSVGTVTIISDFNGINRLFLAPQGILNSRGDLRLYDSMEDVPNIPAGLFSYGGAICFAALQRDGMNMALAQADNRFRLRYVEPTSSNPGCTTGIKMLLDGELSFAQNSRTLTKEEVAAAKLRGFELESVPVAIDGIVFYVNKSLGIKSLSLQQLRDIYLGKINNWQEGVATANGQKTTLDV